jgi:hypothetical protein
VVDLSACKSINTTSVVRQIVKGENRQFNSVLLFFIHFAKNCVKTVFWVLMVNSCC